MDRPQITRLAIRLGPNSHRLTTNCDHLANNLSEGRDALAPDTVTVYIFVFDDTGFLIPTRVVKLFVLLQGQLTCHLTVISGL